MTHKFDFRTLIGVLVVAGCLSGLSACATLQPDNCHDNPPHAALVIFGDSYSDTGNIAVKDALSFPDPFHQGRFSNGLVAVDHLAVNLGSNTNPSLHTISCAVGYNYSVGGGNIRGLKPQDLTCQVNEYLERVGGIADVNALFVVMMGGNDIRTLTGVSNAMDADGDIDQILDQLFVQLERLAMAGASKFLIANSGDMGRLPGIIADSVLNPIVATRLTDYSTDYNAKFNLRLGQFKIAHPLPTNVVTLFDLSSVMDDIIDNPVHGFVNTTQACFSANVDPLYHPQCAPVLPSLEPQIDNFAFFDSVHASAKAHVIIGAAMVSSLP